MRFFAEEYKQINGAYPEGLNQNNKADPWGRMYVYMAEDGGVIIFSTGPDGKKGTADDIY
ncbi:MAG: type II secretion system protein GspG [Nitrospirota bacterium]